jgi:hypothetical protein
MGSPITPCSWLDAPLAPPKPEPRKMKKRLVFEKIRTKRANTKEKEIK